MFKKALVTLDSGKLANYVWFFGCMALGLVAITGMAWAYCRLESRNKGAALQEEL